MRGAKRSHGPAPVLTVVCAALVAVCVSATVPQGRDSYFGYRYSYRFRGARRHTSHREAQQAHTSHGGRRPKAGLHVNSLPPGATRQEIGGRTYYHAQGSWYVAISGNRYAVVKKPQGADAPGPPQDCELVYGGRKPYCYMQGIFYKVDPTGYEVTLPEIGVIVPYLPKRAKKVERDGKQYLVVDGNRFRPVIFKSSVSYQVVKVAKKLR